VLVEVMEVKGFRLLNEPDTYTYHYPLNRKLRNFSQYWLKFFRP